MHKYYVLTHTWQSHSRLTLQKWNILNELKHVIPTNLDVLLLLLPSFDSAIMMIIFIIIYKRAIYLTHIIYDDETFLSCVCKSYPSNKIIIINAIKLPVLLWFCFQGRYYKEEFSQGITCRFCWATLTWSFSCRICCDCLFLLILIFEQDFWTKSFQD